MRTSTVRLVGSLFFPDLLPKIDQRTTPACSDVAVWKRGVFFCTRTKDHHGRHASGDGQIILAVWPQRGE